MSARASAGDVPAASSRRKRLTAAASAKASSCAGRPARRVDAARVGRHERPAETHAPQCERALEMGRRLRCPVGGKRSAGRGRERIEAEGHCAVRRLHARAFDQRGETERLPRAVAAEIELEMRPCVEAHAIESLVQGRGIESPEAIAVGAERAGEHDLQAVRAVGEVVERLGVGLAGVGMVEARDHAPRPVASEAPAGPPPADRRARSGCRPRSWRRAFRGSRLSAPLRRPCANRLR